MIKRDVYISHILRNLSYHRPSRALRRACGVHTRARPVVELGGETALRRARILPVLVASIREAVQNQEFFQVLESGEPRLGQLSPVAPVGERKIEI